jgi:hypothetical protein
MALTTRLKGAGATADQVAVHTLQQDVAVAQILTELKAKAPRRRPANGGRFEHRGARDVFSAYCRRLDNTSRTQRDADACQAKQWDAGYVVALPCRRMTAWAWS